jgi:hypothetical protein
VVQVGRKGHKAFRGEPIAQVLEEAGESPPGVEDEDARAVVTLRHGEIAVGLSVAHNGMIRLFVA